GAAGAAGGRPRRRRWWVAAGVVAVVAVAGVLAGVLYPFGGSGPRGSGGGGASPVLGTVTLGTLTSRTTVGGTLGYAGSYSVINQAQGTYTALPAAGRVIRRGQVLYQVDGAPVVLLYGQVPAYRALLEGVTGADVRELNRDLVTLGYATRAGLDPSSDYFSPGTAYALEQLQAHLGVTQTGSLSLGQAVFLPSAVRVTADAATLGGPAAPGSPALTATSTTPQVTIALDPALQSEVKAGDKVTVTLPDQHSTPGVVTGVGKVASSGPRGPGAGPAVTVDVALSHPKTAGGLDQAPVQVSITTAEAKNVLAVPVTALLATTSGYQIQVARPGGHYRFVPVSLGLFDGATGLVQVTGPGLRAGQKVVEAQS
ncbi:MAG TPA: peptidoglycan-binding protein, partial [Streptosporangiaceae bacterium]